MKNIFKSLLLTSSILSDLVYSIPLDPLSLDLGSLLPKETIRMRGSGWAQLGAPDLNSSLELRFALKRRNVEGLLRDLLDNTKPRVALSNDEVNSFIAAEPGTVATVKQWLTASGIDGNAIKQPTLDSLTVTLPISSIESLLSTKYSLFSHPNLDTPIPRTLSYSLPQQLHSLIDTVQPTTELVFRLIPSKAKEASIPLGSLPQGLAKRKTPSYCNPAYIQPACILSYYNSDWTPSNRTGAQVGTLSLRGISANSTDFNQYMQLYRYGTPQFQSVNRDGWQNSGQPTDEGNLDTQYAGSMASPTNSYYIMEGALSQFSAYAATPGSNCPSSVSISYGNDENLFSPSLLDRVCNDFGVAASLGISIFAASGDAGVGGANGSSCTTGFIPIFPASCPYVTAVGATRFNGSTAFNPADTDPGEVATTNFASGGGFSNHFAMPDYQKSAVQSYIASLNGQYDGQYNKSGRAYPDVSAFGQRLIIAYNGGSVFISGTSGAAPQWSGFSSMINDYQISRGHSKIGLWNTYLYPSSTSGMKNGLKDITSGSNPGCGGNGFPVTQGWDPVTGLGTPLLNILRANAP